MKIELFYFDGCPNHEPALENLRDALIELQLHEEIDVIEIMDNDDAIAKRFLGSPSIRIDGIDLVVTDDNNTEYSMRCRRYKNGDVMEGFPSRELIKMRLLSFQEGKEC